MIANIIVIVALIVMFIVLAYVIVLNRYQKKYYESAYKSKNIKKGEIQSYPEEYKINGIKRSSSEKQYQEAAAFKMINDKNTPEKIVSIDFLNFLMGYTYGASYNMISKDFIPFTEPIKDLAAPFIGLHMNYRTTYVQKDFINGVKYYISQGFPVLLQLDMATVMGTKGLYPTSELIIGYNKNGFYYSETIGKLEKDVKYIPKLKIMEATNILNAKYRKPWRYGFCIFTTREKNEQLNKIIKRNGDSLIGEVSKQTASGADAIDEFIKQIALTRRFKSEWVLEALEYSRFDNSKLLKETFKNNADLLKAAELFEKASKNYGEALKALKIKKDNESIQKVCEFLLESSQIEREIGNIFINVSL